MSETVTTDAPAAPPKRAVERHVPPVPRRVESYLHSDHARQNKGGCLVEVLCQTDFATNTEPVAEFARWVARMAYGFGVKTWADLAAAVLDAEARLAKLRLDTKEDIRVGRIVVMAPEDR